MPAVSSLRRPILVDHTVDFGDGVTVTFRYDRNKITDAWFREWSTFQQDENMESVNKALADLIESWDVLNDDGTPYAPTPENIGFLFSLPDKGRIVNELMVASVPSRAEGNASSVLSSTAPSGSAAQPLTSPNGPAPSPLPTPSASPSAT